MREVSTGMGLLLLRSAGAILALEHGLAKVAGLLAGETRFIEGVARLGFPAPQYFAWAAALTEGVDQLARIVAAVARGETLERPREGDLRSAA